ncbi:hypothetical protein ACJRO7_003012 [Eucalyptus globulus]|uniref:Uncharacterized protein n=1 Tax=Eucalyptus globulus TaxID=34317 RepID=A0ABD3IUY0_EUCGL
MKPFCAPNEFEGHFTDFTDPVFPLVKLVCYDATLWIDVGQQSQIVAIHFIFIFNNVDNNLVGPIPYPASGGGDGGTKDGEDGRSSNDDVECGWAEDGCVA